MTHQARGLLWGFLGVLAFSVTLPATRVAVMGLDPLFVGLGRSVVAAFFAAALLVATGAPRPTRTQCKSLIWVAGGVVLGFPVLTTWAMRSLPASHGAIIVGVLPLATAVAGAVRAGERPSPGFWLAAVAGSALVAGFALWKGAGSWSAPDLALVGAVLAAAIGYAEGARLSREMGGWQVISWALVLSAPFFLPALPFVAPVSWGAVPLASWLGFLYVSLISQFLGFFAWYHGLALGGVARVSQVQLAQLFLTLLASHVLLHEPLTLGILIFAVAVLATVAIGRRMPARGG